MASAAILYFQKFQLLTVDPLPGTNVRHRAKSHQNLSNGRKDMAIPDLTVFFKMAAVRHLGFVGRLLGPSAMTTIVVPNLIKIDAVVSIT